MIIIHQAYSLPVENPVVLSHPYHTPLGFHYCHLRHRRPRPHLRDQQYRLALEHGVPHQSIHAPVDLAMVPMLPTPGVAAVETIQGENDEWVRALLGRHSSHQVMTWRRQYAFHQSSMVNDSVGWYGQYSYSSSPWSWRMMKPLQRDVPMFVRHGAIRKAIPIDRFVHYWSCRYRVHLASPHQCLVTRNVAVIADHPTRDDVECGCGRHEYVPNRNGSIRPNERAIHCSGYAISGRCHCWCVDDSALHQYFLPIHFRYMILIVSDVGHQNQ